MIDWQAIGTAPKDGRPVLLFEPEGEFDVAWNDYEGRHIGRFAVGRWQVNEAGHSKWAGYYSGTDPVNAPTHWARLDAPA